MSALENILRAHIKENGAISIATFMNMALCHPEHGYYTTRDPLGKNGDFITAPEISQIFGELLGIWCIGLWRTMGSPDKFNLIELGPGRGTLMADALRAAKTEEGFSKAVSIHLVENSPVLREKQKESLSKYNPTWYDSVEDVAPGPFIILANEFLDALPIHQFIKQGGAWHERRIGILADGSLGFFNTKLLKKMEGWIPNSVQKMEDGTIYEYSPAAVEIAQHVNERLNRHTGAALFIDYGHAQGGAGDSFQAVYKHHPCPVLSNIGEADLTAHVNFDMLIKAALDATPFFSTQGRFLARLGIEMRTDILAQSNPGDKGEAIREATERLISKDEMGDLFKVMALVHKSLPAPIGFRS